MKVLIVMLICLCFLGCSDKPDQTKIAANESMELKTGASIYIKDVTKSDIIEAFQDDKGRGDFIILSQSEQVYIQAAGEGLGPYILEYRDGDEYDHFQCPRELSKREVESAFMKYLEGDKSWRTDLEWKRIEM